MASASSRSFYVSCRIHFPFDEEDLVTGLLTYVMGDLGEACPDDPSP